jgi:hypothetical protein
MFEIRTKICQEYENWRFGLHEGILTLKLFIILFYLFIYLILNNYFEFKVFLAY